MNNVIIEHHIVKDILKFIHCNFLLLSSPQQDYYGPFCLSIIQYINKGASISQKQLNILLKAENEIKRKATFTRITLINPAKHKPRSNKTNKTNKTNKHTDKRYKSGVDTGIMSHQTILLPLKSRKSLAK